MKSSVLARFLAGMKCDKRFVLSVGVPFLLLAFGCSGEKESGSTQTASKKPAATKKAPVIDAATAGTISGKISFSGTAPKMGRIDVSSEATCHEHSKSAPVLSEEVVVNDNGTLRNVFVYVKTGLEGMDFPAPSTPVVLDQKGCQYFPHVFGIQANQPLLIKNSDEGVLHNIHALSEKRNGFNFGMPKVMESTKAFKKAEVMVKIKCDVHGWMNSYAGVLSHPYHAVTGADGSYKLPNLPPGQYTIEAWHEKYGAQTETVTVAAKDSKDISFTFAP